jgi:hypothetical protein
LGCGLAIRQTLILRKHFQSRFVGTQGIIETFEMVEGRSFARIPFGEIGIEADAGVGVFQGVGGVIFGEVGCGTVGVEYVIGSIDVDGVGVVFDCFAEVFGD